MRLVSKIVRERDLKPALDRGINSTWYSNPDAREVWDVLVEHWQTYGEVPTASAVRSTLPNITLIKVEDSYDWLLDSFVAWRRRGLTVEMLQDAIKKLDSDNDHEGALRHLESSLAKIEDTGAEASRDEDLTQSVDERLAEYAELKNLPDGLRGIPTGFPTIDRATSGLQGGQLVTLIATPKCGKSTFALAVANNIHEKDKSILLVSYEMTNKEQAARHDAMRAHISHSHLTRGLMSKDDERRLKQALRRTEEMRPFSLINDPATASTVSGVTAKVELHNPDVLFVDGVYLMIDEISGEQNTPQALTNITRNLKRLAMKKNIPVFISTQALAWKISRKKGLTASAAGYSSSFFQDSDVMLGLEFADDDEDPSERLLKVLASRNCPNVETTLSWSWDNSTFEEV